MHIFLFLATLTIFGDIKLFGKVTGSDIVANKKTILSVKTGELLQENQKKSFTIFSRIKTAILPKK